jgi:hypothetical protein
MLVYAFAGNFSNLHSTHPETRENKATNIELSSSIERVGEAKLESNFKIYSDFIDDMNNCHRCNKIDYIAGEDLKAGVAFINSDLNLIDDMRIVFFARGNDGGEEVSFVAIGRDIDNSNPANLDLFPNQRFGIVTKNVTLDEFWRRYEISLDNTELKEVTHPFGFVIYGKGPGIKQTFYLKGVSYDSEPAINPLPLINSTGRN